MLDDFQLKEDQLNTITKVYHVILNIIYLFVLDKLSKGSILYSSPKLGKGLNVTVLNGAIAEISNLAARNNLNIFVSQGMLVFKKNCFVNNCCSFNCLESIQIGENTIFGEGVKVYDHDHLVNDNYVVSKNNFATSPVTIGANCWIGSNTVILKGDFNYVPT